MINTANDANVHYGLPTRKYVQGEGYDNNHIIQLATYTIPRTEAELGGVLILGQPQTYQLIISRSTTDSPYPFQYTDRYYGTKQPSGEDYLYYSHYKLGYVGSDDGTSKLSEVVMHTVGQNTTDQSKIYVSSYIVDSTH